MKEINLATIAEDFKDVKKSYNEVRAFQRKIIIEALNNETKYTVLSPNGGKGKTDYTSGGTIAKYDLSNWKWIEIEHKNLEILISLQPAETDPNSKNSHVLFDRIGFMYKDKIEITAIDLPLTDKTLGSLIEQLNKFILSIMIPQ